MLVLLECALRWGARNDARSGQGYAALEDVCGVGVDAVSLTEKIRLVVSEACLA